MEKTTKSPFRYRFRDYRTPAGRRVVAEYVRSLPVAHREAINSAMRLVRLEGLGAAQKIMDVDGGIYEVRAQVRSAHYRIVFAPTGKSKRVFITLLVFDKNDQKMRLGLRDLAARRLREWRASGR